tara:strand:- start:672 stop:1418 length:747 start_codon:yes stop_codon:yes gene_type:complete
MNKSKYYKLFTIDSIECVTEEELRKKYHKLCLKYHPDKNTQCSKDKFIEIQHAYEFLIEEKRNFKKENVIYGDTHDTIYETLLSLFNMNTLEKMIQWLQKYHQKEHIIYLHASLSQLFHKDVYIYENLFIPLWFRVIYRKELEQNRDKISNKNEIFCIIVDHLPKHIRILENNDILMTLTYELNRDKIGKSIKIHICESKSVKILITEKMIRENYHIILHEGIPRIQRDYIYDISELSNIILCFSPTK